MKSAEEYAELAEAKLQAAGTWNEGTYQQTAALRKAEVYATLAVAAATAMTAIATEEARLDAEFERNRNR